MKRKYNVSPDLGHQIRVIRQYLNMTQAELAKKSGISRTQITNLELGNTDTSIGTLNAIARAFHCNLVIQFSSDYKDTATYLRFGQFRKVKGK